MSKSKRGELVVLLLLHLPVLMLPTSAEMKPADVPPLMGSLRGAHGRRVVAPCALSPQVAACACCTLPVRHQSPHDVLVAFSCAALVMRVSKWPE